MTPDEHQRERMRLWIDVAAELRSSAKADYLAASLAADKLLSEFDKRFPAPSAAAPVEPVPAGYKFSIGPQIASVDSFTGSTCTVQTIDVAELTALHQKARLWDAVRSGKMRLEVNNHGRLFIVWYGPESRGIRTEGFPTAEEAVESAIAQGALK